LWGLKNKLKTSIVHRRHVTLYGMCEKKGYPGNIMARKRN
jgi:hypothetical protein